MPILRPDLPQFTARPIKIFCKCGKSVDLPHGYCYFATDLNAIISVASGETLHRCHYSKYSNRKSEQEILDAHR